MSVDKIAPQSTQQLNVIDDTAPSAKKNAVELIDSNVANGLMNEKDAGLLTAVVEGRSKNFSSSNGFLNSLVELLEFAATTKAEVNLTRFEIIDNERIAKIDAAQESLDGARMGFIVSLAGAGASLALGGAGNRLHNQNKQADYEKKMAKYGEDLAKYEGGLKNSADPSNANRPTPPPPPDADTSMLGVLINLSSQLSQSATSWTTQSYEFKAATFRADADEYGALGRSDVLNADMENMIRQAIAASAN